MTTNLTIVTQLPIVESQLREASAKVDAKVQEAMALVCTEETVKAIKEVRASLNKEFKDFEDKRKEIKAEIMKPYDKFEIAYKDFISNKYKMADEELKNKIDTIENSLKEQKKQELVEHFTQYAKVKDIDFVKFEQAKINITLSASMKSLKEQVENFLDRIESEVMIIQMQDYKDEIMYEYKKTLDISYSIKTVTERKQAIQYETQIEANESKLTVRDITFDGFVMNDYKNRKTVFKIEGTPPEIASVIDYLERMKIKYVVEEIYEHI